MTENGGGFSGRSAGGEVTIRSEGVGNSIEDGVTWGKTAATVIVVYTGQDVQPDVTVDGIPRPPEADRDEEEGRRQGH